MKEVIIDLEEFKKGFYALDDTTKAPYGSLRVMRNAQVTNKGGLAPRPGTELLGSHNSSTKAIKGFYSYKKSFGTNKFLVKCYDDEMEALSLNHLSLGWFRIKNGFTAEKEFGFVTSLVNTDNQDYLVGCNRYDPYFRWTGAVTQLNGALVGGETAVTVDSTLTPEIFESKTASGSSATTLDVATTPWATDMWVNFYVYITSGAHAGKIRLITDNDSNTITFDTLGSDPGACTFEIRQLAFPVTGTLIYNGTTIAYTGIPTATTFTVASAHAGSDNDMVTLAPTEYPANPRGDRMTNYLNRVVVGHVRSAMARDSGGALSGFSSGGSAFVSKINNPFDFGFSAARVAGEGDIISMPYGGGEITDVQHQEDGAYVFKEDYIEQVTYSQDTSDLAVREPLKAGVGSIGKTIKGADDIYFITKDKRFTSIGRVKLKDLKPETENIGLPVQDYLKNCVVDEIGRGKEIEGKIYIPLKSSSEEANNNAVLIYNKHNKGYFEGIWEIPVFGIEEADGEYYYAESNGPDVYKMLTGEHSDVVGSDRYPIVSEVATHFMNFTPSKANLQAMFCLYVEGYIRAGTTITFQTWKDFATDPFLEFNFVADSDTGLLDGQESNAYLGGNPLAINPLGASFSDVLSDGRRHFSFRVYFPYQYGNYFSIGHFSDGADYDYEITRYGLGIKEDPAIKVARIKVI
jgi:hypothetical protein